MREAVPSGSVGVVPHHTRVRFSFRADFFSDGFYGFHTAKTNIEEAYVCTALCVCVAWDKEMLPIGVGSSVSTFLKTVVCVAFAAASVSLLSLLAPEVKGSSEKYRMMRTDKYHLPFYHLQGVQIFGLNHLKEVTEANFKAKLANWNLSNC